jgi:hypothetical protein
MLSGDTVRGTDYAYRGLELCETAILPFPSKQYLILLYFFPFTFLSILLFSLFTLYFIFPTILSQFSYPLPLPMNTNTHRARDDTPIPWKGGGGGWQHNVIPVMFLLLLFLFTLAEGNPAL